MPWSDLLLAAIQYKSSDSVLWILQSGANPNGPDKSFVTPLELATESDDFASIQSLVEHRADVNLPNRHGETPLHIAAFEDTSFESFELILNAGADINITDKSNKTALHLACSEFNPQKIKSILKLPNPPVNCQDDEGATPMHLLVYAHLDQSLLLEIIKIALKKGFDINSQTFYGETILQVGSQHSYSEMLLPDLLKLNNIDITLQDDSGDNFLYSFLTYRNSVCIHQAVCNINT
jgi:ankyrin repeat protein